MTTPNFTANSKIFDNVNLAIPRTGPGSAGFQRILAALNSSEELRAEFAALEARGLRFENGGSPDESGTQSESLHYDHGRDVIHISDSYFVNFAGEPALSLGETIRVASHEASHATRKLEVEAGFDTLRDSLNQSAKSDLDLSAFVNGTVTHSLDNEIQAYAANWNALIRAGHTPDTIHAQGLLRQQEREAVEDFANPPSYLINLDSPTTVNGRTLYQSLEAFASKAVPSAQAGNYIAYYTAGALKELADNPAAAATLGHPSTVLRLNNVEAHDLVGVGFDGRVRFSLTAQPSIVTEVVVGKVAGSTSPRDFEIRVTSNDAQFEFRGTYNPSAASGSEIQTASITLFRDGVLLHIPDPQLLGLPKDAIMQVQRGNNAIVQTILNAESGVYVAQRDDQGNLTYADEAGAAHLVALREVVPAPPKGGNGAVASALAHLGDQPTDTPAQEQAREEAWNDLVTRMPSGSHLEQQEDGTLVLVDSYGRQFGTVSVLADGGIQVSFSGGKYEVSPSGAFTVSSTLGDSTLARTCRADGTPETDSLTQSVTTSSGAIRQTGDEYHYDSEGNVNQHERSTESQTSITDYDTQNAHLWSSRSINYAADNEVTGASAVADSGASSATEITSAAGAAGAAGVSQGGEGSAFRQIAGETLVLAGITFTRVAAGAGNGGNGNGSDGVVASGAERFTSANNRFELVRGVDAQGQPVALVRDITTQTSHEVHLGERLSLTDTGGLTVVRAAGYSAVVTNKASDGALDTQLTQNADGSRVLADYDQANARTDAVITTYTDAQNRLDAQLIVNDDTSSIHVDLDQAQERTDSMTYAYRDNQGRLDLQVVVNDNGSSINVDWDQAHARADSVMYTYSDTRGRADLQVLVNDNGTSTNVDFDQDHTRADAVTYTYSDTQGRTDTQFVLNDDGSSINRDFDQAQARADSVIYTYSDTQGRADLQVVVNDNGSTINVDWDQAQARTDAVIYTYNDTQGRADLQVIANDDLSSINIDWDQGDLSNNAVTYTYSDTQGRLDLQLVVRDDNSSVNVDWDQAQARTDTVIYTYSDTQSRADLQYIMNDDSSAMLIDWDQTNVRADAVTFTTWGTQGQYTGQYMDYTESNSTSGGGGSTGSATSGATSILHAITTSANGDTLETFTDVGDVEDWASFEVATSVQGSRSERVYDNGSTAVTTVNNATGLTVKETHDVTTDTYAIVGTYANGENFSSSHTTGSLANSSTFHHANGSWESSARDAGGNLHNVSYDASTQTTADCWYYANGTHHYDISSPLWRSGDFTFSLTTRTDLGNFNGDHWAATWTDGTKYWDFNLGTTGTFVRGYASEYLRQPAVQALSLNSHIDDLVIANDLLTDDFGDLDMGVDEAFDFDGFSDFGGDLFNGLGDFNFGPALNDFSFGQGTFFWG